METWGYSLEAPVAPQVHPEKTISLALKILKILSPKDGPRTVNGECGEKSGLGFEKEDSKLSTIGDDSGGTVRRKRNAGCSSGWRSCVVTAARAGRSSSCGSRLWCSGGRSPCSGANWYNGGLRGEPSSGPTTGESGM